MACLFVSVEISSKTHEKDSAIRRRSSKTRSYIGTTKLSHCGCFGDFGDFPVDGVLGDAGCVFGDAGCGFGDFGVTGDAAFDVCLYEAISAWLAFRSMWVPRSSAMDKNWHCNNKPHLYSVLLRYYGTLGRSSCFPRQRDKTYKTKNARRQNSTATKGRIHQSRLTLRAV